MTLCFIHWGHYAGFPDVLACAKARANCPIWVISDGIPKTDGVNYIHLSEFPDALKMRELIEPNAGRWASFSLARWFVLREFAARYADRFPFFCADWDVMLFRDLAKAYEPFLEFDYTVSIHDGMASAAYGINRLEPLHLFCEMVAKLNTDKDPRAKGLNDMEAWAINTRTGFWKVGNLFEIQNGSVFDHNMCCGADRFVLDGRAKKIVYQDGQPCFVLHDGKLILANSTHCWGSAKTRTKEFREGAGIAL